MTSDLKVSEIIVRSAAFGAIAQIDNFYASALPPENKITGKSVERSTDRIEFCVDDEDEVERLSTKVIKSHAAKCEVS